MPTLVPQATALKAKLFRGFSDVCRRWIVEALRVAAIARLTLVISGNWVSTASVLVVACSCSLALATPIAMLASIGMGAQRGLLIKDGKYLEELARADVLLINKTGTVTLGRPQITDIVPLDEQAPDDLLRLAASCERYSEHPLAEAVRREAVVRGLALSEPLHFEAAPDPRGSAQVRGDHIAVGHTHLHPPRTSHTHPRARRLPRNV